MNAPYLTNRMACMHNNRMIRFDTALVRVARMLVLASPLAASGCITLEAPTEPIVIELNINITQEVIYRLAEDAGNTIEENADIF